MGAILASSCAVVDEDDRPLKSVDRATIHRENLLHRAVHILLVNHQGELLSAEAFSSQRQIPGALGFECCGSRRR